MAITKASYGTGPKIPAPPGYTSPTPHAAHSSHDTYTAPSNDGAPANSGTGMSTDHIKMPKATKPRAGKAK